jgi:hypothetical protein
MTISMRFVRITLTVLLLFLVYRETGPWTVLTLGLVAAANELQGVIVHELWRTRR